LLLGLLITLVAVVVYSLYTANQIHQVRQIQQQLVDRNRRDSLQLLRIQDNLNALGLAMRDMLDATERYPLTAWSTQVKSIRRDLDDAFQQESQLAPPRSRDQTGYLMRSQTQFWEAFDRAFERAAAGDEAGARQMIRDSLQARQAALTSSVARLLVHNNEAELEAVSQITSVYDGVERNVYLFLAAMLCTIALTGTLLFYWNQRLFRRISDLSSQKSELSRRLITTQEETLRHVSRELHDEFGQILTAVGAMLQRAERRPAEHLVSELQEVKSAAQEALEKVRSLSQTLQPVILEEAGLLAALDWYIPVVERQTGLKICYERPAEDPSVSNQSAIHVYRVIQESLNNIVRHAGSKDAVVRLRVGSDIVVEVEDHGTGFDSTEARKGIGLVAMRERATLLGGKLEIARKPSGTLVRLTVPNNIMEEPVRGE
jgi:signal transduction histidine kinase